MSTGVVKTSALFGSPSGESPTDSNPFAFVTLNKPQPLEQIHHHNSLGVSNSTQNVPFTTSGLDHLYSSQPFGVTQEASGVTHQQVQEDGLGYSILGSTKPPPASSDAVLGSTQAGSGTDFFDSIPQVVPLHTQVSNPLQHQSLQGGSLVNRTGPFDSMGMGQPPATENEHSRHNSLPSMGYPDFYSGIQQPSLPAVSLEEHSPQMSDRNRTSASAPSTGVHPLQSTTHTLTSEHQLTSLPLALQSSPQQPNSEDPIPRPPSNADVAYTPHHFGANFNNTQHPSYPFTNADVPEPDNSGMINEPTLTNATNATQKPPIATPELNTNIYSATLNQPELMPTQHTGLEEDPLSNLPPHGTAHNTSVLNDSMGSQSMSSLLQDSRDEFAGASPVRLLPPTPVSGPQSSAPISLNSPVAQESLGGGLSLMPPAPLEQVLHPPVSTVSHKPEIPVSVYEPHTNALPLLTNATNKQQNIEDWDWEIVDNVPPDAMVSNVYSHSPAHQASATDTAQQTAAQLSSLTLEDKTQQQQQHHHLQGERGDDKKISTGSLATLGVSENANIMLDGTPPLQNVYTYAQDLQSTQSSSQPKATNLQLQGQPMQPLPTSQVTSTEPITSDVRPNEPQANYVNPHQVEEPSNLVNSMPVAHPTNVTSPKTNLYVHSTPVVSTAPNIPPTTSLGVAGYLSQMPPSSTPNMQNPQAQVCVSSTPNNAHSSIKSYPTLYKL